ncbi:MAG: hypothetical protein Q9217_004721 [Psora testacea]
MATKISILLIYHGLFKRANDKLIRATRAVIYGTALLVVGYYVAAFFVRTSIRGLTIAIVEMDIGIIAASLIVMRPCFQAIRKGVPSMRSSYKTTFASSNTEKKLLQNSGEGKDKVIVRTFDVELDSQPSATGELKPRDMLK